MEELEKKLHEAHTKGLEETTEVTSTQPQQVAAPQEEGEEDNSQPSKAQGSSDGPNVAISEGAETLSQQVAADAAGVDAEGGTEREVLEDKENNPALPQPVTPPKSKHQ